MAVTIADPLASGLVAVGIELDGKLDSENREKVP
jgi:hypothetical protein